MLETPTVLEILGRKFQTKTQLMDVRGRVILLKLAMKGLTPRGMNFAP